MLKTVKRDSQTKRTYKLKQVIYITKMGNLNMSLTNDMKEKVRLALREYSEHQVANMYGLRIETVRREKLGMRQLDEELDARRRQDILNTLSKTLTATGRKPSQPEPQGLHVNPNVYKYRGKTWNETVMRDLVQRSMPTPEQSMACSEYTKEFPNLDFAGLEGHVLSGFFTPSGQPTPAFWGYLNQYVKKSGHTMLDILHDKEIYAPEQLERALDIDSQLEDMTQEQRIALLRRVSNAVYEHAFKDPTGTSTDLPNGE